jgi:hypothetical protein
MNHNEIYTVTRRHNEEINTRLQKLIEIIQNQDMENFEARLRLTYELGRLSATVKGSMIEVEGLRMSLAQRLRRNRGIDPRDPDFDEDLAEMTSEQIEDALEWEAEERAEREAECPY